MDDLRHETLKVIRGTSKFSQKLLSSLLDEATEKAQEAQAQLETYQKEYQSLLESSSGLEQEYHQILSWADLYDHCSIAKKKMIVSQLIKAVYVRRDYEITVEFNISFDDFHTLEYHEKGLSQNDKSTLRQPLLRKLRKSNEIVLKKSATIQKGIASFQNCCVFSVLC